ncbi:MAG: DUF5683 domain-containing protein [Candidatus Firestonebacteria bacterium]
MMKKIVVLFLFVIMCEVDSSEKIKMGVLDLDALNVSKDTGVAVSEVLRTEFFNTGRFTIVDKKNMDKILKEQAFQKTGCTSTDCAVEVGRILNISSIVTGSLSKVGNIFMVTISLVDVESAEEKLRESGECNSEDKLSEVARKLAINFAGKMPVTGKIVKLGDTEVIVDLGSVDNVTSGMKFVVNRLKEEIKDGAGRVIMKEWDDVGEIELTEVQQQASKAKVLNKKKSFIEGDVVKIGELTPVVVKVPLKVTEKVSVPASTSIPTAFDAVWRSALLPGWGQFYNKDDLKGWVFTVAGALMGLATITSYADMQKNYDQYKNATDPNTIENYYQQANYKYQDFKRFALTFGVVWALNVIDSAISFNPEKQKVELINSKVFCKLDDNNIKLGYTFKW